jgi:hypothetical protein
MVFKIYIYISKTSVLVSHINDLTWELVPVPEPSQKLGLVPVWFLLTKTKTDVLTHQNMSKLKRF